MAVLDFLTMDHPFSSGFSRDESSDECTVALVGSAAVDVSQG